VGVPMAEVTMEQTIVNWVQIASASFAESRNPVPEVRKTQGRWSAAHMP